jgi:2-aminoadipate transaminase
MRFDMGQNQMALRMMANFILSGALTSHLPAIRRLYKDKMNTLADALEHEAGEHLSFVRPKGGFYLWATLRDGLSARSVWRTAAQEGVAVNPGHGFLPGDPAGQEFLRIAFAWTPPEQLHEAAHRIGVACARVGRGDSA